MGGSALMCGRFAVTLPTDAMAQLFAAQPDNAIPDAPNYNICPTQTVAVVTGGERRRLQAMRWGFLPHWYKSQTDGPLLINARAETLADKPAFRSACRTRRCVIPATGFYEWTKDETGARDPWYIYRSDGAPLLFAAVWQDWGATEERLRTCAIVTCSANTELSSIHHRMPVILEMDKVPLWLGEAGHGAATLMTAAEAGTFSWHRVDRAVNSNRACGPQLIHPHSVVGQS